MGTMDPLQRYTAAATRSAGTVIGAYSTSFGLATKFLGARARRDIANLYALVRLADEIVDGVAVQAGLEPREAEEALDRLESETEAALDTGYSTNLVVHAFAATARSHDITTALTRPFFTAMRTDLHRTEHTEESLADYIYGSAEVVGLMCLAVFRSMPGTATTESQTLARGAQRLGAAFQKINFLRDLGADRNELGRCYFPGVDPVTFSDVEKHRLVADIRQDLDAAEAGIGLLDLRARLAVGVAHRLFHELTDQIDETPAQQIGARRIRVNNARKVALAVDTALQRVRRGSRA